MWKIATSAAAATAPPAFTQTRAKVFAAFTFNNSVSKLPFLQFSLSFGMLES